MAARTTAAQGKTKNVVFRCDEQFYRQLKSAARKHGLGMSRIIRDAVVGWCQDRNRKK